MAALLALITDIHSLGLKAAEGLLFTEAYYWDQTDETRAFAKRFAEKNKGKMPTSVQAGFYSATLAYLNAVKAAGQSGSEHAKAVPSPGSQVALDERGVGPDRLQRPARGRGPGGGRGLHPQGRLTG